MKDRGPNWGLAFGSASFLIVWCVGFLSNVAIETIALRACAATILGALVGIVFGQTLEGVRSLRAEVLKGSQVDFTVKADPDELTPVGAESTVPAAAGPASSTAPGTAAPSGAASATVPDASPAVGPDFKPLDFKSAARQIQATMKE